MTFEDQVPENANDQNDQDEARPKLLQSTGLGEIIEKMAEEKRRLAETANGDVGIAGENEIQ